MTPEQKLALMVLIKDGWKALAEDAGEPRDVLTELLTSLDDLISE